MYMQSAAFSPIHRHWYVFVINVYIIVASVFLILLQSRKGPIHKTGLTNILQVITPTIEIF